VLWATRNSEATGLMAGEELLLDLLFDLDLDLDLDFDLDLDLVFDLDLDLVLDTVAASAPRRKEEEDR